MMGNLPEDTRKPLRMAVGSILIIEDEIRLRNNLQILLSRAGYTVTTAGDGRDGIECLRHASFDVVITDLMMRDVNGFKAMEYMTAQASETPVIVISGYASTASAIEAIREGAYDYIAKPFDIEILQVSIERAIEKMHLQRELQAYGRTSKLGLPSVSKFLRRPIDSYTAPWPNSNPLMSSACKPRSSRPWVNASRMLPTSCTSHSA